MGVEVNMSVKKMWEAYLMSINETVEVSNKKYEAWSFGNDEKSANELAKLVKEDKKTSTSSLHCLYLIEDEGLPEKDEYSIILDGNGEAQCIIKTTNVKILPFNEVTEEFAKTEGEGDRTLEYWREVHRNFFCEALINSEKEFTEDMLVVCEEFEVVYPAKYQIRTRNLLIVILSSVATILLALVDIIENGSLTTGFLGMFILIVTALIIPTIRELMKENKKQN
jgi:uncharacterized protein YhfF